MSNRSIIEKLAQAFNGNVVQNHGHRGIIYIPEKEAHFRYHPNTGLEKVVRDGERWHAEGEAILIPSEIIPFLESMGIRDVINPSMGTPLPDRFISVFGGEIVDRLRSGGAVVCVRGRYLRVSQIQGLDFVRKVSINWRFTAHVWTYDELLDVLFNTKDVVYVEGETLETAFRKIKEGIYHGRVQQAG